MEIERKWMVSGWPEADLPLTATHNMRQGYLVVEPTVRIREEKAPDKTEYVLCIKSGRGIAREEIEILIEEDKFRELERIIGYPLIPKERRTYLLPDGLHLEVNHVDEGLPTEFWYAEIEYPDIETARSWDPAGAGLEGYLGIDVTDQPGQSMGAFWIKTRLGD
ncbi:MAG: hypothetical protein Q4G47_06335 [Lachnospiraceae bacterium]|nr:hypothetical protein [Lachnospiraceae bacterium]